MLEQDRIIKINIEEEMKSSYIDYSMSVIVARALPDVRDGFKPVHRRILYGMIELGNTSDKAYKKSARIVGEVLGKYHPHGDFSVYGALVRMAQDWAMRYPLVDGQGNFGSVDGDSPAAMRYTEARLKKIGEEMMQDLYKETVDFQNNFDDTLQEPTVMPTRIPNLLVNGASGIAVGMATNMPTHNLSEVIDACIAYIDNNDIDIEGLMQYVKAPDFPTGGYIYGISGVRDAYETGRGRVVMRAKAEIETVWLTQKQMGEVFEVKQATLSEHINNIISSGELDETSIGFSDKSSGGRKPKIYNLDMILSVGYRVNSKRGIAFRRWANSVLKKYVIQGYAINEKRLQALERTVDIQTKMLASTLEVEESDILKAVTSYTDALMLLDQYDHQSLKKPVGNRPIYKITYEECKKMVSHMEDSFKSDVFGVEKENGKVEGILAAVYQSVFGGDVYPSLEEKAANLLYFMIKDHPYADGCKRIAASLFLEFLARNNALYRDDNKIISDGALVAITLMIAESRPEEKDIMVNLVMNFLTM